MERDVTLLAGCAGQTIRYANPPCFSSNTLFAGLARGPVVTLTKQKSSPYRINRSGSFIYQPAFAVLLRPCTPQPILVIVDRLSALERRSDRVTMGNGFCARRELRSSRSPVYRQRRRRAPCRPSWWEIVSDRRATKTAAKHLSAGGYRPAPDATVRKLIRFRREDTTPKELASAAQSGSEWMTTPPSSGRTAGYR